MNAQVYFEKKDLANVEKCKTWHAWCDHRLHTLCGDCHKSPHSDPCLQGLLLLMTIEQELQEIKEDAS